MGDRRIGKLDTVSHKGRLDQLKIQLLTGQIHNYKDTNTNKKKRKKDAQIHKNIHNSTIHTVSYKGRLDQLLTGQIHKHT